jgi:hypothetical protein
MLPIELRRTGDPVVPWVRNDSATPQWRKKFRDARKISSLINRRVGLKNPFLAV